MQVMDWDQFGSDDPLGDLSISLRFLTSNASEEFAEKLVEPKGSKGVLQFAITWLPAGDVSYTVEKDKEGGGGASSRASSRGIHRLSVATSKRSSTAEAASSSPRAKEGGKSKRWSLMNGGGESSKRWSVLGGGESSRASTRGAPPLSAPSPVPEACASAEDEGGEEDEWK